MPSPLLVSTAGGASGIPSLASNAEIESLKQQIASLTVLLNQTRSPLGIRSRQRDLADLQSRLNLLQAQAATTPGTTEATIPRLTLGEFSPDPVMGTLGLGDRVEVSDLKSLYIGR